MLPCRIPSGRGRLLGGQPDHTERGMIVRIEGLALQRDETAAQDRGLRRCELLGKLLEPFVIGGIQIDLNGSGFTHAAFGHDYMS